MSNRQFWSFLELDFIYNCKFAKLFYKAICDFNDNSKLDYLKFMDYPKFIQFVTLFTKNGKIDDKTTFRDFRINLIFKLFDPDGNEEVDRLEFRNIITSFVEMVLTCKFDAEGIQDKIKNLNIESSNISLMEKALDSYVDEMYNIHSYNGEVMSFEEWRNWLFAINGLDKIMEFTASLKV